MANSFGQIENIVSRSHTDNIFILGKGASADEVSRAVFDTGITITLNDAEKIARGDIGIFHAPWVLESLRETGFLCQLYITNQTLPGETQRLYAEYLQPDQFSTELLIQRFFADDLLIEDVMLVTAIKVARIIATYRMRRQKVYLIGFDFDTARGYSKRLDKDYSGDDLIYQSNVISAQEHYLLVLLHLLRDSNLHLIHVGKKSYSTLGAEECNRRLVKDQPSIETPEITSDSIQTLPYNFHKTQADSHVLIAAEITTNHFGDLERLEKMVRRAKDAGADLVKVQKRDVKTFYTEAQLASSFESPFGSTFGEYRQALELNDEGFHFLRELSQELEIQWFPSVLDLPSFEFVMRFDPPMIKLPSTISQHTQFLEFVAKKYTGDLVISTGLTDESYEDYVLDTFASAPNLYLLQCTSAYPTPPGDCHVAVVRHYRDLANRYPNLRPGYSSHDFGSTASMLAVAAGAKMLEKHVKFGDAAWAHFDSVALDLQTDAFHRFVADIRLAERLLGKGNKSIADSEHHKYWTN